MSKRPERIAPPELFYDEKEAGKYSGNSRIITIQTAMAERCLELLSLRDDAPRLILDIGCGSGLSGDVLSEAGHAWVGLDISPSMLEIALQRDIAGDVLLGDMGQGFGFRAGMFDGAVSVSALQWLCYSDKADHRSTRRLNSFFTSLYRCLRRGARAALQIYPESPEQLDLISQTAAACGFGGGLVVDFPNSTKAKKFFLCLYAGSDPSAAVLPVALGAGAGHSRRGRAQGTAAAASSRAGSDGEDSDDEVDEEEEEVIVAYSGAQRRAAVPGAGGADGVDAAAAAATFESRRARPAHASSSKKARGAGSRRVPLKSSKAWILAKKEGRRLKGFKTAGDSKYTGRKRSGFKM